MKLTAQEKQLAKLAQLVKDEKYDFTFQITPRAENLVYCQVNAQFIEANSQGTLVTKRKVTVTSEGKSIIQAQINSLKQALILLGVVHE